MSKASNPFHAFLRMTMKKSQRDLPQLAAVGCVSSKEANNQGSPALLEQNATVWNASDCLCLLSSASSQDKEVMVLKCSWCPCALQGVGNWRKAV